MSLKKLQRFKKKSYRSAYSDAHIEQGIATQIRVLRESRGWDQKELATRIGLRSQSAVARLEDPSYGKHSLSTLKKISHAFDIALLIKFASFGQLLAETANKADERLNVLSFDDEVEIITKQLTNDLVNKIFTNTNLVTTGSRQATPGLNTTAALTMTPKVYGTELTMAGL